jgi:hypothetical protein
MTVYLFDPDVPGAAETWADLLARTPHATPHATLPFVRAVAAEIGARVRGLVIADDEKWKDFYAPPPLLAGVLVCEKRRGPWRCAVQPPLAYYHGPVLPAWPSEAEVHGRKTPLDALLTALTDRYDAVALALPPRPDGTLPDVRPLQWHGFTPEVRYTYRLTTGPADAVRAAMRANARRALDEASPALEGATPERLAASVAASYARHGRTGPLSEAALARVACACLDAGLAEAVAVGDQAALVGVHGASAYDLLVGGAPGADRTRLVWALAAHLHARGIATLDLTGANTPSIAEYKRRLGARLVPFVRATWHRPGLSRLVAAVRPLV